MGGVIALLLVGIVGGSLVNYLADVLPQSRRITRPLCWNCSAVLPWSTYLLLRRCGTCASPRTLRTYLVQLLLPAAALYLWLVPPHQLEVPAALLLATFLVLIAVIDIEHRLILHVTSVVGALLGLAIGIHLHELVATLIGGAAGYGLMLLIYLLGEAFMRVMAKRRGEPIEEVALGYGDVNLAGTTGLLLGWPGIAFGLVLTILAGGLVSLIVVVAMLIRRRYRAFSAIPYGPFLILSIVVLLFRP
jgi:leader peptidase (prepilin peptidase)/N-methyltransferase